MNNVKSDIVITEIKIENESKELKISQLLNEYFDLHSKLCDLLTNSNISLSRTLIGIKQTERDAILVSLRDNERLSAIKALVNDECENKFKLERVSYDQNNKIGKDQNNKIGKEIEKGKKTNESEIVVKNPLNLINGGLAPFAIRQSHSKFSNCLNDIIEIANIKVKLLSLLKEIEKQQHE
ncbi:hypothetical protein DAMA08_039710 [Martiniozyma asiatica (nom. inval.)]|nr:hypothetical protein DAMA08_039710 [Martiniozyma asiatica]